jgi:hypothetical protein
MRHNSQLIETNAHSEAVSGLQHRKGQEQSVPWSDFFFNKVIVGNPCYETDIEGVQERAKYTGFSLLVTLTDPAQSVFSSLNLKLKIKLSPTKPRKTMLEIKL